MAIHRELILASDRLPTLPAVAIRLIELARDPQTDNIDFVQVIKSDPAIAAKVLRTVNSSLFGLRHPVSTIEQAIPLLGPLSVCSLVLSFSLLTPSSSHDPLERELLGYWRSSLTQAVAASELAKLQGGGLPSEHFVAGLLQDLGALALLRAVPDEYLATVEEFEQTERPLIEIELERLGVTHPEITLELLRRWHMPEQFQLAAATHHTHPADLSLACGSKHGRLQIACGTAAVIGEYYCRKQKRIPAELVQELLERFYEVTDERHTLLERIGTRVHETAELFAIDLAPYPSYRDILATAGAELVNIACKASRDKLTGARTQRDLEAELDRRWKNAIASGDSIALLRADADGFKQLNATHGVPFGDKILRSLVRWLEPLAGPSGLVARCGPDEFMLLVERLSDTEVRNLAEEIRRSIACHAVQVQGHAVEVTVSIGAAVCTPQGCTVNGPRELVAATAEALNRAKQAGGNQLRIYTSSTTPAVCETPV